MRIIIKCYWEYAISKRNDGEVFLSQTLLVEVDVFDKAFVSESTVQSNSYANLKPSATEGFVAFAFRNGTCKSCFDIRTDIAIKISAETENSRADVKMKSRKKFGSYISVNLQRAQIRLYVSDQVLVCYTKLGMNCLHTVQSDRTYNTKGNLSVHLDSGLEDTVVEFYSDDFEFFRKRVAFIDFAQNAVIFDRILLKKLFEIVFQFLKTCILREFDRSGFQRHVEFECVRHIGYNKNGRIQVLVFIPISELRADGVVHAEGQFGSCFTGQSEIRGDAQLYVVFVFASRRARDFYAGHTKASGIGGCHAAYCIIVLCMQLGVYKCT